MLCVAEVLVNMPEIIVEIPAEPNLRLKDELRSPVIVSIWHQDWIRACPGIYTLHISWYLAHNVKILCLSLLCHRRKIIGQVYVALPSLGLTLQVVLHCQMVSEGNSKMN